MSKGEGQKHDANPNKPVKVEIKESSEGDLRTLIITLTAPASDFQMVDLLRQGKVTEPLNRHLRQTIRDAIESYLTAAESLVLALASKPTQTLEHRISDNEKPLRNTNPLQDLKYPLSNK